MDQYAVFVWSSYAVTATIMIGLLVSSVMEARSADRLVEQLRGLRRRRRQKTATADQSPKRAEPLASESMKGETGA